MAVEGPEEAQSAGSTRARSDGRSRSEVQPLPRRDMMKVLSFLNLHCTLSLFLALYRIHCPLRLAGTKL